MVYHLPISISVCNTVDQASSPMSLPRPNANRKSTVLSSHGGGCDRSRSAAIDVVILIAVVIAVGFLILPSAKFLLSQSIGFIREEFAEAPVVYGAVALSVCSAAMAAWGVLACMSRKCGNPSCKGLRKAAEFDIQLETEDCVKNSGTVAAAAAGGKDHGGVRRGLFELPRDHHRELEAELRKMAPPNGRAVLVFRARCGCSVGRLEVPGTKKIRKIKK